jgi:hypothetical protein
METLLGIGFLATPVAALVALVAVVDRRRARRLGEIVRQITLTDALHARLGAVAAPVVRWGGRRWQVTIAVPFERPEVVTDVVRTVDEVFGPAAYEVVLCRQAAPAPRPRARRPAALGEESLSWI